MITQQATAPWLPPGIPAITRLGIIDVTPGKVLTPDAHKRKLAARVQQMVDVSGMTMGELDELVRGEFDHRGFTVAYRTLRDAGKDLVDHLDESLQAAGALISVPIEIMHDVAPTYWDRPMSVQDWIKTAALLLPPIG